MNYFENKSCRFCLNDASGGNFQVFRNTIKEVIDILLPKLNLDETKYLICSTCFVKLKAALDFKSICLDTDDCIFPYVNDETALPVDLKVVYIKEKGKEQSIKMSIDQKICRLCMRLVCDKFTAFRNVEANMIITYIPELNFDITKDPVICKPCFDSLNIHSGFIKDCLDIDEKFQNNFDDKVVHSPLDSQFSGWFLKTEEIAIKCDDDDNEIEKIVETNNFGIEGNKNERNGTSSPYEIEQRKGDLCALIQKSPSDMHKCNSCDYKTKRKYSLKRHMLRVHKSPSEIEWHECNFCIFKAKVKSSLKTHMLLHKSSKIKWFKCNLCDFKSKYNPNLMRHLITHESLSEIQWYECNSCDFKSKHQGSLMRHMLRHMSPAEMQWYECKSCNYKSKYKSSLRRHMVRHKSLAEIQWYQCKSCDYQSKGKGYLRKHILSHQKSPAEIQWYKCNSCDYKSKRKRNLVQHMVRHQSPAAMQWHECNSCDFKSKHNRSLMRHLKTHKSPAEVQWYKCSSCHFKSRCKKSLVQHMIRHKSPSETKWYECKSCNYKSKHKSSLIRHMNIHKSLAEI